MIYNPLKLIGIMAAFGAMAGLLFHFLVKACTATACQAVGGDPLLTGLGIGVMVGAEVPLALRFSRNKAR